MYREKNHKCYRGTYRHACVHAHTHTHTHRHTHTLSLSLSQTHTLSNIIRSKKEINKKTTTKSACLCISGLLTSLRSTVGFGSMRATVYTPPLPTSKGFPTSCHPPTFVVVPPLELLSEGKAI